MRGVIDELVAADNQPAVDGGAVKSDSGVGGVLNQPGVGFVAGGHLRQLADGIAESGGVGVVVRGLNADDDIALLHPALQAAGATGVDDAAGAEFLQQHGGGDGGVHLADAALREQHRFAREQAAGDGDMRDLFLLRLADATVQQGDFLLHRADDGDGGGFSGHVCVLHMNFRGALYGIRGGRCHASLPGRRRLAKFLPTR